MLEVGEVPLSYHQHLECTNVAEVEGACESEASFLLTSSPTMTFIEFSMELLNDSMNDLNSVMVSEMEELELAPPLSRVGAVCGGS